MYIFHSRDPFQPHFSPPVLLLLHRMGAAFIGKADRPINFRVTRRRALTIPLGGSGLDAFVHSDTGKCTNDRRL